MESYLTLDSCQAARASFWFTEASAVASTGLPGEAQGMKLPLFLPFYAFHPSCKEESMPLFGRVRKKENAALQVGVADGGVSVIVQHLIRGQSVCFSLIDGAASDQLRSAQETKLERRSSSETKRTAETKLTLCFNVWNLSSLRRSRSLSLRLCLCCRACSASEYLCRALCCCLMPRLAPP